jgi:hypothetical protein
MNDVPLFAATMLRTRHRNMTINQTVCVDANLFQAIVGLGEGGYFVAPHTQTRSHARQVVVNDASLWQVLNFCSLQMICLRNLTI